MWAQKRGSHRKWLGFRAQITRIYRHTCGQRNPAYETRPLAVCKSSSISRATCDAFGGWSDVERLMTKRREREKRRQRSLQSRWLLRRNRQRVICPRRQQQRHVTRNQKRRQNRRRLIEAQRLLSEHRRRRKSVQTKVRGIETCVSRPDPWDMVCSGPDASAAVGLAPATPQTPGQDPVPHISDNDSTGGLMETVDENPNDTCNVKQWMLFSEATRDTQDLSSHLRSDGDEGTVEIHDDEQVRRRAGSYRARSYPCSSRATSLANLKRVGPLMRNPGN